MSDMDLARSFNTFREQQDYLWATHLQAKLRILAAQDVDFTTPHAKQHKYVLGSPVSERILSRFEAKWGISIPGDYRAFLRYVGDGGPGPGYGLEPFRKALPRNKGDFGDHYLSTPFEHTQPAYGAEIPTFTRTEKNGYYHGTLYLGNGCNFLVVSGPGRGQVWEDEARDGAFAPVDVSFTSWYDRWIDKSCLGRCYRTMMQSRYIVFTYDDAERFRRFSSLLQAISDDLAGGTISTLPGVYDEFLDEVSARWLRSSTQDDHVEYLRQLKILGSYNRPPSPSTLADILNTFRCESYHFFQVETTDGGRARMAFTTSSKVMGSYPVFTLLEAFKLHPIEAGDGRGPYPSPRWDARLM